MSRPPERDRPSASDGEEQDPPRLALLLLVLFPFLLALAAGLIYAWISR